MAVVRKLVISHRHILMLLLSLVLLHHNSLHLLVSCLSTYTSQLLLRKVVYTCSSCTGSLMVLLLILLLLNLQTILRVLTGEAPHCLNLDLYTTNMVKKKANQVVNTASFCLTQKKAPSGTWSLRTTPQFSLS